jgi:ribosomal protein L11 methyltransferase
MYSLRIACSSEQVDWLSGELWEAGTAGILELDDGGGVVLVATFERNDARPELLERFARYAPKWEYEPATDWIQHTRDAWPAREIGNKLFLAPPWCSDPTPQGRERVIHNPGLACGTGEHPCTQLALRALEECITADSRVIDIGTGSGILAISARRLGAGFVIGFDVDEASLHAARENFLLNELTPRLVAGSAQALAGELADITVANINGTVLLSMLDELLRITRTNGWLILTGFTEAEVSIFQAQFSRVRVSEMDGWCCMIANVS